MFPMNNDFLMNTSQLENRITRYWNHRADDFTRVRHEEFHSIKKTRWLNEIRPLIPAEQKLRILDIGTGSGFFPMLLAPLGHIVTGIDLSPLMIASARHLTQQHGVEALFFCMNAQTLDFDDQSFDLILTRNLTWTLPDLPAAYREWHRVLRSGGRLLNFDADYGAVNFLSLSQQLKKNGIANAHQNLNESDLVESDTIKSLLSVSHHRRPDWDRSLLQAAGFENIQTDLSLSDRIETQTDASYNPVRMFRILADKPIP